MRYKMIVSYDGTFFHGFQRQTNLISVQSVLEETLTEILKTPVIIHGAGRTDALVHAYGQVVHFDSTQLVPPKNLKKILNKKAYPHIYVSDIELVDESFHSRKSAKGKEYHYIVDIGEYDPLKNNYVLYHHNRIDIDKIKQAMTYIVGTHDFKSLSRSKELKEDTMCVRLDEVVYSRNDTQKLGIQTGDIIAVFSTGAYHYSMSSNYNQLPKPAVVFTYEGKDKLVIRRQTFDDLVLFDVEEDY